MSEWSMDHQEANMNENKTLNRHLVAFITFIVLVPLVYFIPDWVAQFLPQSKLLNVVVAVAMIVPIITYIVMPLATRHLSKR